MLTLGRGRGVADRRPPREQCEDGVERGECSPLVLPSNKPCMRTAGGLVPTCSEQPVKGKQRYGLLDFCHIQIICGASETSPGNH